MSATGQQFSPESNMIPSDQKFGFTQQVPIFEQQQKAIGKVEFGFFR